MNNYIKNDIDNCLFIYERLLKAFDQCDQQSAKYYNLIAIYFHDIMRILTGYFLKVDNLRECIFKPMDDELNYSVIRFPYISYSDVINGIAYLSKDYSILEHNLKCSERFFGSISRMINGRKKTIGLSDSTIGNKGKIFSLINKGYNIKFIENINVDIPNLDIQMGILNDTVQDIFNHFNDSISPDNMINLIKNHINASIVKSEETEYDLLLVGTMTKLNNRLHAANARSSNIPVISVSHGEGDQLMFDEPRFGYSERTFPDILFGYGPSGNNLNGARYLKCLFGVPKYSTSNSSVVLKTYQNSEVKPLSDISKLKFMYISDSLQFVNRYGPWINIPDGMYLFWQSMLIKQFPDLIYKRHPKGHPLYSKLTNDNIKNMLDPDNKTNIKVIGGNFADLFDMCDAYIFDHISTAFMIACATNKPIIYFNIGKRNLTNYAKILVHKRCYCINIDPETPGDLIEKINEKSTQDCINKVTTSFSIDENINNIDRDTSLINLVDSILKN